MTAFDAKAPRVNLPSASSREGISFHSAVDRLRASIDLVDVISQYVHLKKTGANFKGLCPFHQERTPSFQVNQAKQLFYCFGCGTGGDMFSFVMKMDNVAFADALQMLAKRAGIDIQPVEKPSQEWKQKDDLYKLHAFAAKLYQEYLREAPEAESVRRYVEQRNVSPEAARQFELGYAPAQRDFFLERALQEGYAQAAIIKSGLVIQREDGGLYDRFRSRLMFPIQDGQGRVMAFGGRAMEDVQPKYLNSPETPIYQKGNHLYGWPFARAGIGKQGHVVVVEGYMDCLMLHQHGITNVVATLGTALTPNQATMIKRYTDTCYLAFDVDAAGVQASGRGAESLIEQGLLVKIVPLASGKDPDEFVSEVGAAGWAQAIAASPNFFETVMPQEVKTLDQKLEVVKRVIPLLAKVQNEIEKSEYVKWVASRIHTEERFIWKEIRNVKSAEGKGPGTGKIGPAPLKPRESTLEETERQMLKLLVEDQEFSRLVRTQAGEEGFAHDLHRRIAKHCLDLMAQDQMPTWDQIRSAGIFSEEEIGILSRLEFVEFPPLALEKMREEFLKIMTKRIAKNRQADVKKKMDEARQRGEAIEPALWEEWLQLTRQLKGSKGVS